MKITEKESFAILKGNKCAMCWYGTKEYLENLLKKTWPIYPPCVFCKDYDHYKPKTYGQWEHDE